MLAPDVWSFRNSSTNVIYEEVQHSKDEKIIKDLGKGNFNSSIFLVMPRLDKIPESILNCVRKDSEYYVAFGVPILELLNEQFVHSFVKQGKVFIMGEQNAHENVFVLGPDGCMMLKMNKSDAYDWGIEGVEFKRPSKNSQETRNLRINLAAIDEIALKKIGNRLRMSPSMKHLNFNLVFSWEPGEERVCSSSIAAFFTQKGVKVELCNAKIEETLEKGVEIPAILDENEIPEIVEWLGALILGVRLTNNICKLDENVLILKFTGFFSSVLVDKIYKIFRQHRNMWFGFHVNRCENACNGEEMLTVFEKDEKVFLIRSNGN